MSSGIVDIIGSSTVCVLIGMYAVRFDPSLGEWRYPHHIRTVRRNGLE